VGQTFYAFAGGVNVARTLDVPLEPALNGGTSRGFSVTASVGTEVTRRLGWRLDAFASQFELTERHHAPGYGLCVFPSPPYGCGPILPSQGRVAVTGVTANGLVNLLPATFGPQAYLIGGVEMDHTYQELVGQGALWIGVSAGAGVAGPAVGRLRPFVEARYRHLLGAPSQLRWLAPITFGVRF
jgi:hypothetical protein